MTVELDDEPGIRELIERLRTLGESSRPRDRLYAVVVDSALTNRLNELCDRQIGQLLFDFLSFAKMLCGRNPFAISNFSKPGNEALPAGDHQDVTMLHRAENVAAWSFGERQLLEMSPAEAIQEVSINFIRDQLEISQWAAFLLAGLGRRFGA